MRFRLPAIGLRAALALVQAAPLGAQEVAQVLGVAIDRSELPVAEGPAAELGRLYDRVWQAVSRYYVRQNGLEATPEETAEVLAYEREFERRDRDQRARKLEELDRRLAGEGLEPAERARLEDFRATLARLAQSDDESDREPPPDPQRGAEQRAQWIEMWKMNGALYRQYGGIVALTRFGPYPHGARLALIADYERRGLLRFSDLQLRERLLEMLAARPSIVLAPEQVDFTPFWKRPIPPSYFPD